MAWGFQTPHYKDECTKMNAQRWIQWCNKCRYGGIIFHSQHVFKCMCGVHTKRIVHIWIKSYGGLFAGMAFVLLSSYNDKSSTPFLSIVSQEEVIHIGRGITGRAMAFTVTRSLPSWRPAENWGKQFLTILMLIPCR